MRGDPKKESRLFKMRKSAVPIKYRRNYDALVRYFTLHIKRRLGVEIEVLNIANTTLLEGQ